MRDFSFDILKSKTVFFDFIRDKTGFKGISVTLDIDGELFHHYVLNDDDDRFKALVKEIFDGSSFKVCWGSRQVTDSSMCMTDDVIDLSFFFEENSLTRAAANNITDSEIKDFLSHKKRVESHVRACKISKVDLNINSLQDIIPKKIMLEFYRSKNDMLSILYSKVEKKSIDEYREKMVQKIRTFYEMERNGVCIDNKIKYDTSNPASRSFMKDLEKISSRFAYVRFNLTNMTKTGRVHTEKGSFQCMGIPKNEVRSSVISRFKDGMICSLDMNAADYRCIIASVDDAFVKEHYKDAEDFHTRTAEFLFGDGNSTKERRRALKMITYTLLYGGSDRKLSEQTGLSKDVLNKTIEALSKLFGPIYEFKREIVDKSKLQGFVEDPLGDIMKLDGTEHDGKIFALYAQRCCSLVFMDGVIKLHEELNSYESVDMFTVHDEVVIDMHPDELQKVNHFVDVMERGTTGIFGVKMKVNSKIGLNYWETSK